MDAKSVYGLVSVAVTLIGIAPYIAGMLRGHTKPHMFSWFLWGFTSWIVMAAQTWDHAGAGSWAMLTAALVCTSVFILCFWVGEKNITRADWVMFSIGLAAVPAWMITKNPLLSVVIVSLVDLVAYGPTIRKSWTKPRDEVAFMYMTAGTWQAFSLLAMERFTLVNVLSPASLLCINCLFVPYLLIRRRFTDG
ncbi:MAG: hypothetical protein H6865_02585 [Rhodospirillales bacterium]|nr:hypothetical protein [Alphaproteobacteria bacterium]MCB9986503.1 hypothetical protein [Rhodospirillales bacterium]USO06954.1 MAG: hypothetical protein H6866_05800 [Rhodospirillales bacterium]